MVDKTAGQKPRTLITGGAGFIGSALVRLAIEKLGWTVTTLDKLTYAASMASLDPVSDSPEHTFIEGDIADRETVRAILTDFQPELVINLAAESHVDRSIDEPSQFISTNIEGVFVLLEELRKLNGKRVTPRLLQVSTDEVFGSLDDSGAFTEMSPYRPNSPYSASKAAADHLARAWGRTYGLPIMVSHSSNNYGPYQHPEKLIPRMILSALGRQPLPVYGDGLHVRDWLHVEDNARALADIVSRGTPGESYTIGGLAERTNLSVVRAICDRLDDRLPGKDHARLITHVDDRPGHDRRYAIDPAKVGRDLGWSPTYDFDSGLKQTVDWYCDNEAWWRPIIDRDGLTERLGLAR